MAYNLDITQVIKRPVSNEKAIRLMESENKLVFVVDMESTKTQIKAAVKKLFDANAISINTYIAVDGTKRAYVQFDPATPAIDVATKLGIL